MALQDFPFVEFVSSNDEIVFYTISEDSFMLVPVDDIVAINPDTTTRNDKAEFSDILHCLKEGNFTRVKMPFCDHDAILIGEFANEDTLKEAIIQVNFSKFLNKSDTSIEAIVSKIINIFH